MSADQPPKRKPAIFRPGDRELTMEAEGLHAPGPHEKDENEQKEYAGQGGIFPTAPALTDIRRGIRWGALLIMALIGLAGLSFSLWISNFIEQLFAARGWIGWSALALLSLAVIATVMLSLRELFALLRLRKLARLQGDARAASRSQDIAAARMIIASLREMFGKRKDMAWSLSRLAEYERDILDGYERLVLAERELIAPLDARARVIVSSAAKRISVVTAISPFALIDIGFVAFENMRMLRRLAVLYGGRPGTFAMLRLARMVVTHLAVTGGMAIGDDLLQQLIGHKITAKISSRLGEGVLNGALTARIGIAAMGVIRPLPYMKVKPPRFRDFAREVFRRS